MFGPEPFYWPPTLQESRQARSDNQRLKTELDALHRAERGATAEVERLRAALDHAHKSAAQRQMAAQAAEHHAANAAAAAAQGVKAVAQQNAAVANAMQELLRHQGSFTPERPGSGGGGPEHERDWEAAIGIPVSSLPTGYALQRATAGYASAPPEPPSISKNRAGSRQA